MSIGDHIQVKRKLVGPLYYMHHGIEVDEGMVVHACPNDPVHVFGGGKVIKSSREEFACGERIEVVSDPPANFSSAEVAARAMRYVNRDGYCPIFDNCEHFASWCATGIRKSQQIDSCVVGVGRVVMATATLFVARTALGLLVNSSKKNRLASVVASLRRKV